MTIPFEYGMQTGDLLIHPLERLTGLVLSITFPRDGTRIVSECHDNTVSVWEVMSGRLILGHLCGHWGMVGFVGFSLDGKGIVSASWHREVCV
jgi:WD40 repeat protein